MKGVVRIDFDGGLVLFDCDAELVRGERFLCGLCPLVEQLRLAVLLLQLGVLGVGAEAPLEVPAKKMEDVSFWMLLTSAFVVDDSFLTRSGSGVPVELACKTSPYCGPETNEVGGINITVRESKQLKVTILHPERITKDLYPRGRMGRHAERGLGESVPDGKLRLGAVGIGVTCQAKSGSLQSEASNLGKCPI